MINLNRRERYLLSNCLKRTIEKLNHSGDFPEKRLYEKLNKKVMGWVWEAEGDITSDKGVGEQE